ncbi:glycoside hydrolase family 43 protein [Capsulimonas corticalis]|nr:glycoside hydrolase family 43 protein [Capsulimonas corticalis]
MKLSSLIVLSLLGAAVICLAAAPATGRKSSEDKYTAYLMAYFGPEEKLFYAVSRDARHWTALNDGKPVLDPGVRLRDPYFSRVNGVVHLVHTKAWDTTEIFHWESTDLIHWKGGPIQVVGEEQKRAWAPEFIYSPKEKLFYVFWASEHNGHNVIYYVTTRDWSDITPERAAVYYDLGIHDIDFDVVEHKGTYYAFHKPGDVDDLMGNRLTTSRSLDPKIDRFGKEGAAHDIFPDEPKPIEGPEAVKLIGEDRWYIYGDPFNSPMAAWETRDFTHYVKIDVATPHGSKHCSVIPITEDELKRLEIQYPPES